MECWIPIFAQPVHDLARGPPLEGTMLAVRTKAQQAWPPLFYSHFFHLKKSKGSTATRTIRNSANG